MLKMEQKLKHLAGLFSQDNYIENATERMLKIQKTLLVFVETMNMNCRDWPKNLW